MIEHILARAVERKASDIIIIAGLPVAYKINCAVEREDGPRLRAEDTRSLAENIYALAENRDLNQLLSVGDDDFSFSVPGLSRFRVNALRQRGSLGLIIRVLPYALPDYRQLGIPDIVMEFARRPKGLVLITGAAGSGKSTTLACMINEINHTKNTHIITIEDPLEYLHQHKKSVVTQRELHTDTASYQIALRAALREAPDIILLGEMRDAETIAAAVTAAETGHLILSTLHTIGAANTVDRIIDIFPPAQQQQIRIQLSLVLEGVVSQQLIPTLSGELAPAFEVLAVNNAVRNIIRESKAHQLDNIMSSSAAAGMTTMNQSLLALVRSGKIAASEALSRSINPDWLHKRLSE